MSDFLPSAVLSVSELNAQVAELLTQEIGQVKLSGEISGFSRPASGHWYFSLKDNRAQIRCAMFRASQFGVTFFPLNGHQVVVLARVSLYEPRGEYQLIVETLQIAGEGDWRIQFEKLKQKLNAEGLFSVESKKPLPHFTQQLGIITSSTGAALYDVLQILKRREPGLPVIIYPAIVQGNDAPASLIKAIEIANLRAECDLLIVGRGGGSPEDLSAFNDERVVRAIYASIIPIVSAVGHETDITFADFVADLRAPTPSAAAEIVSRNQQEQHRHYQEKRQRLEMALDYYFSQKQQIFAHWHHRLRQQHPQLGLIRQQMTLTSLQHRLSDTIKNIHQQQKKTFDRIWNRGLQWHPGPEINDKQHMFQQYKYRLLQSQQRQFNDYREKFSLLAERVNAISPLATLARGYTITLQCDGKRLNDINQIRVGDKLKTQFFRGSVESCVISAEENDNNF